MTTISSFFRKPHSRLYGHNPIEDENYAPMIQEMHIKLDSVQQHYKVTEKELEKVPQEKIDKAYADFERLRGNAIE